MKKSSTRRIWIKWSVLIIGVVFIIFIIYVILGSVIQNKIAKSLHDLAPGIQSSYSAIHVNLLASSVTVDSLQLIFIPDSALQQHRHSIYFQQASLSGIDFLKVIFSQQLFISNVNLEKAQIKLDQYLLDKKDSAQQAILKNLRVPFKNITIKNLTLSEAAVWLGADSTDQPLLTGNISLYDQEVFASNITSLMDSSHLGGFDCSLSDIHYSIPGRYHTIHIKKLAINSKKEILQMDSIKVIPRWGKMEFGRKLGRQADRVEGFVGKIEMTKLNVAELMHNKLIADRLILSDCDIHIFRDRKLPRKQENQPMLNDYLEKIEYDVRINLFKLKNASVYSEELPKDGTQTGYLKINKINLSMTPVINHVGKNSTGSSDTYVEGSIMNSGTIRAHIHSPLKKNIYEVKGRIENLDLPNLNPSAENLGKFHVESGILNFLDFHFVATEEKAVGEIIGEYHNLVLEKLKNENGKNKVAAVPTFFLKHLIIPKNKDKSMDVARRTGKIDYKRDPTRVVSFYFLKSLLDGIRASFDLGFLLPQ